MELRTLHLRPFLCCGIKVPTVREFLELVLVSVSV